MQDEIGFGMDVRNVVDGTWISYPPGFNAWKPDTWIKLKKLKGAAYALPDMGNTNIPKWAVPAGAVALTTLILSLYNKNKK